ncbi:MULTISPECIES: hypothetical protein [Nocardia]|uniref:hypothetical protein n=1 Tax=Nocardia TaxID=1817 RepID=UPI002456F2F1|nr:MULTISPECIES: hypothetical protein [Nocardia]
MTREEDLRFARALPLHLLGDPAYLATFDADDAPEFSVICLAADSMSSLLERARKYPGWVEVIVHYGSKPAGPGQSTIDVVTRQILPKQFDLGNKDLHDQVTVGQAFDALRAMELRGVDVFGQPGVSKEAHAVARELVGASRRGFDPNAG